MEKLSYNSLVPHLNTMRSCGIFPLDSKYPKLYRFFHKIYMCFSFSLILMYTTQEMINIYQVRDDADKVMDTMFLMLSYTDCICKQIIFWTRADKIEMLLDIMKGELFNQNEPEYRDILLKTCRRAKIILRTFNAMCLATTILWTIFPIILRAQNKPVVFAIWLPFDTDTHVMFYFALIYVFIQTTWLGYVCSTMDCFMAFVLAQCKTQLYITRIDIETLIAKSVKEAIALETTFTSVLRKRFRNILLHYDEIVKLATKCQDVFGIAMLYQFLISGWIICTTAYRTVNMCPLSVEFFSMVFYMCCIITQFFLYCYYGNEVTYESIKMIDSVYAMDWLNTPLWHQRDLLIFMERIKRPIDLTAGIIISLSASTFISIVKSSYTFYAFLKNTNN